MLKGDQLYISEKEVGALSHLRPCMLTFPVLSLHRGLTCLRTPLPSTPFVFLKQVQQFGWSLPPITSAEKGHPFPRRPELGFQVASASYWMIFLREHLSNNPNNPPPEMSPKF